MITLQFNPPTPPIYRLADVRPQVRGQTITLSHSKKWDPPCVLSTVVVEDPEFVAVHVQCAVAERDIRQGWYYYYVKDRRVMRLTWRRLPGELQELIRDGKPCYARDPS
jgi:hypothetical protein